MKSKLKKFILKVVFLYATLFPASGLITEIENYNSKEPEDTDEHMFI